MGTRAMMRLIAAMGVALALGGCLRTDPTLAQFHADRDFRMLNSASRSR
jgi:hypothetical protein